MILFKKYKLGELYNVSSGLSKPREEFGFGHPFVTFKDVFNNYFLPDKLNELANTTEKEIKSCSVKKGDIFLTRTSETMDELGMSSVALKDYPNATFNGFTKRLRLKEDVDIEIDPVYIGYYFRTNEIRNQIDMHATMTTRASLNSAAINSIEISIPDVDYQISIGKILKRLDDKIELNRRTNQTLEQIAQTLFKKYFVDDIDTENLPDGWEMLTLGDSVSKSNTGADAIQKAPIVDYDSGIRCARVGDMTNKRPYHEWGFCEIDEEYYENFKLLKYDILITRTATLGINTIIWEDINAVFNNGLIRIRINSEFNPLFVYQALQTINYEIYIERISGDSSTRPNMQIQYLLDFPMLKPPKKLQDEFSKQIEILLSLKYLREAEIMQLAKLRDTILPKLMSGEIEVNAAEKELVN